MLKRLLILIVKPNKYIVSQKKLKFSRDAKRNKMNRIYLYGQVGWDITPQAFLEQMENVKEGEAIEVVISSAGGSVFDGLAVADLVRDAKADVLIAGIAASMGSVIAVAGKKVRMTRDSVMMIHNPWTGAIGDEKEMKKVQENLAFVKQTILGAYAAKTGLSEDELTEMMDKETWLNAETAIAKGFADEVVEPGKDEKANLMIEYLASIGKVQDKQPAPKAGTNQEEIEMSELKKILGLSESATDTEVQEAVKNLKTNVVAAEAEKAQILAAQMEAEAVAVVDGAISAGKLLPAVRDAFLALARTDLEKAKAQIATMKAMPAKVSTPEPQSKETDPIKAAADYMRQMGRFHYTKN
jgi:ATP-dependent Clp protease, protease subunit